MGTGIWSDLVRQAGAVAFGDSLRSEAFCCRVRLRKFKTFLPLDNEGTSKRTCGAAGRDTDRLRRLRATAIKNVHI